MSVCRHYCSNLWCDGLGLGPTVCAICGKPFEPSEKPETLTDARIKSLETSVAMLYNKMIGLDALDLPSLHRDFNEYVERNYSISALTRRVEELDKFRQRDEEDFVKLRFEFKSRVGALEKHLGKFVEGEYVNVVNKQDEHCMSFDSTAPCSSLFAAP